MQIFWTNVKRHQVRLNYTNSKGNYDFFLRFILSLISLSALNFYISSVDLSIFLLSIYLYKKLAPVYITTFLANKYTYIDYNPIIVLTTFRAFLSLSLSRLPLMFSQVFSFFVCLSSNYCCSELDMQQELQSP